MIDTDTDTDTDTDEDMKDDIDEAALVRRWMLGNEAAVDFILLLFRASHLADDVVDGDSFDPLADQGQLWAIFFGRLMPNPFFQAHVQRFAGAITPAVHDWVLATRWQREPDTVKRLFAYVLRLTLEHAVIVAADIVGGFDHAQAVATEMREVFHIETGREALPAFLEECDGLAR
jgi:hypothetical protein